MTESEPRWSIDRAPSTFRIWIKRIKLPFTLATHYADIVTDIITMINFYQIHDYSYFGVLLASQIICRLMEAYVYLFDENHRYRHAKCWIIWLLHFDLIDTILDGDEVDMSNRKIITIVAENIPSMLITVHSIFTQNNTNFTTQLSVAFSLLDMSCQELLFVVEDRRYKKFGFNLKSFISIIYAVFEKTVIILLWGFYSNVTRPVGAWVYFPYSLFLMLILPILINNLRKLLIRKEDHQDPDKVLGLLDIKGATGTMNTLAGSLILGFFFISGIFRTVHPWQIKDTISNTHEEFFLNTGFSTAYAMILMTTLSIVLGVHAESFYAFFNMDTLWTFYGYVVIICGSIWFIMALVLICTGRATLSSNTSKGKSPLKMKTIAVFAARATIFSKRSTIQKPSIENPNQKTNASLEDSKDTKTSSNTYNAVTIPY